MGVTAEVVNMTHLTVTSPVDFTRNHKSHSLLTLSCKNVGGEHPSRHSLKIRRAYRPRRAFFPKRRCSNLGDVSGSLHEVGSAVSSISV